MDCRVVHSVLLAMTITTNPHQHCHREPLANMAIHWTSVIAPLPPRNDKKVLSSGSSFSVFIMIENK